MIMKYYNDPSNLYRQYAKINEQAAVVSDDPRERIAQYLDNDDFLEKLAVVLRGMDDGDESTLQELQISPKDFGILEDDIIHVKKSSEDGVPKFTIWVMNEEFMYGDIDFDNAAFLLNKAANDGGTMGYIGNMIGSVFGAGDPGDSGTDEELLLGVAGALGSIASEKQIDPNLYFKKLAETYTEKYGKSMVDMLNTEFSGRAEATALNLFRQEIDPSVARGINLGSILLDIGLTFATFGTGTIARGMAKTGSAVARVTSKVDKASKTGKLIKVGDKALKGIKGVVSRIPGWRKIPLANRVKLLETGEVLQKGKSIGNYASKSKNIYKATFMGVDPKSGKVLLKFDELVKLGKGQTKANALKSLNLGKNVGVDQSRFLVGINPTLSNKILDGAGLAATAAALTTADQNVSSVESEGSSYNSGIMASGAEIMGWYDGVSADPNQFLDKVESSDETALAEMLVDLEEGSGFWGNTTNQEELQIALIITSLSPENAKKVQTEYQKKGSNQTIYALLDDELGGDMGMMAKSWWAACTGDGIDKVPYVTSTLAKIKKSNK